MTAAPVPRDPWCPCCGGDLTELGRATREAKRLVAELTRRCDEMQVVYDRGMEALAAAGMLPRPKLRLLDGGES